MSAETGHVGLIVGAISCVAGILAVSISMAALGVPWWACTSFAVCGVLWVMAAFSLSDRKCRTVLRRRLRDSNFTQIYTSLVEPNLTRVWDRLCDTPPESASLPALFRAALTWRLYDFALRLAVAYPILLLVGQWVVTGAEGRVGSFTVLPAADFWPERAAIILMLLIVTAGVVGAEWATSNTALGKVLAESLFPLALLLALWVTSIPSSQSFAVLALLLVVTVVFKLNGVVAFACLGTVPAAVVFLSTEAITYLSVEFSASLSKEVFGSIPRNPFTVLFEHGIILGIVAPLALAFVLIGTWAYEFHNRRGKFALTWVLLTVTVIGAVLVAAMALDWAEVNEENRSLFLFLAVMPLINALFDVVSYAVTLSLIRRGLRENLPFLFGLADLVLACGLLLGLGAVLVAVIHGLNVLAGVPFLDLPALFAGVEADPKAYIWLYLMLFSTLLPTLLHGLLSLLGLQGIWPLGLRRPVAAWVETAPQSPLHAIRASLGLSVVWALPLLALGAVIWGLWLVGGSALMSGLDLYLKGLLWIADGPIDAI